MNKKKSGLKRERTAFEWVILGVSAAAIVAIIGGLVVSSLGHDTEPAALNATLKPEPGKADRYVLTIANRGGTTAEDVRVQVRRGSGSVDVEFRAVPKGDEEEALVEIGGTGRATAHVQSYQEP